MANCINKNSPEFKTLLEQTNMNPVILAADISLWQKKNGLDKFPTVEDIKPTVASEEEVSYALKSVDILMSEKAKQVFEKGRKNNWPLDRILTELQVPKDQQALILASGSTDREQIAVELITNYSYAVEINTTKEEESPTRHYGNLTVPGGANYTENEIKTPGIIPVIKGHAQFATEQGIGWFRSDDKIEKENLSNEIVINKDGDTYYTTYQRIDSNRVEFIEGNTEQEVKDKYNELLSEGKIVNTPLFVENPLVPKTRRILEVQSDLFQKGRDREELISAIKDIPSQGGYGDYFDIDGFRYVFNQDPEDGGYFRGEMIGGIDNSANWKWKNINSSEFEEKKKQAKLTSKEIQQNQFLQLLNKGGNWINFFVKSIIQDSAKKGYKSVLFPLGDTASKIEGHTTLAEFKKDKEERIKYLENLSYKAKFSDLLGEWVLTRDDVEVPYPTYETEERALSQVASMNRINAREVTQIKKELDRVETEGIAALKPIYNFYENTVANILKKQGYNPEVTTDEHGNSWNKVTVVESRDNKTILLQKKGMSSSIAAPDTLDKVKEVMKQMGVSYQLLHDYVKGNPAIDTKDVNGLADLTAGVIAVAQGAESVSLTEEMVHIATAILEQVNPSVMTSLISKIDKYKIYKTTLEAYKGNKYYQLSNGKPDIRKIKKEAVDKLIAELIVNNSEGSAQFPELLEKSERNKILEWWNTILDHLRSLFGRSKVDLFSETAAHIMSGNIGTIEDIKAQGVYFQVGNNPMVDKFADTINDIDNRMILHEKTDKEKRHYTLDDEKIANSVTEVIHKDKDIPDTDPYKMEWGLEGHRYMEKYIKKNLIDQNGFKKPFTEEPITTTLDPAVQEKIRRVAENLIKSYPEGTRFLIEKMVVNRRVKGMLGSTVDFIAVFPVTKPNGAQDIGVDVLDWKFTSMNKSSEDDIHWLKQKDWKLQMGEYTKIMYEYGLKPSQLRKTRMIPFIMNYDNVVPGDSKSGFKPVSIEVGDLDNLKETQLYLLPVPTNSETTGNEAIDDLLKSLRSYWDTLYSRRVTPEARATKIVHLNQLSKSIRTVQVALNFSPLVSVGRTFVSTSRTTLDTFKNIDYEKLSKEQIEAKLQDLIEFKNTALNFTMLDEAFISQYGDTNLSDEDTKTLLGLKAVSANAKAKLKEILDLQREYVTYLSVRENFISEENKTSLFDAEREIGSLTKNFIEGSRLPAKLINFASNLIMRVTRLADQRFIKKFDDFRKVLLPLEQEASRMGKKAFDLIGTVDDKGLHLIKKVDKKFWKDVKAAKEKGKENKKFLMENMDMAEFNKLAAEVINKGIEELKLIEFSDDKDRDAYIRNGRIKRLKNSIDINRKDFNGYNEYLFNHIFNKVVKTENHLSDEYKKMAQNKAALDAWEFFTALNIRAKELGYIDKQGMSFFPLVEASIVDKFKQSNNYGTEFKNFFKDLYTVKEQEEQVYSKKDSETGELKKSIPKYFTKKGNTAVEHLSTDLNKVGALWIKSLMDYEARQSIENTLLTIQAVERAKGSLIVKDNGDLETEGGKFKVNKGVNKNADILDSIINDALYDLQEDLGSLGNISIGKLGSKFGKTEEERDKSTISIKKGIKNADTLTRALAVGLKPLIGFANWMGYNFHAVITGGNMYTVGEFIKNNAIVTLPGTSISMEDKALFHLVTTAPEDDMTEMRRKAAREKGLLAYLSTWSFTDVMMITNSFPEKKLAYANAKSFNDNAIIIDGKIINARQYLKKQDSKEKYKLSHAERRAKEKTFDSRVKELINNSTTLKSAVKITDEKITIEGVSDEEVVRYSLKVSEFARNLNGSMNDDNKAAYRRDTMFSSFMMFKNWIPKLMISRTGDIKYNLETEDWEYGRMRAFAKVVAEIGLRNILKVRGIVSGTEEGLATLRVILENKRIEHLERTGQELIITEEEFFDLMRRELSNEIKELAVLASVIGFAVTAMMAEPPEDATRQEKNNWKLWAKASNKMLEELSFYYSPLSWESVTRGSVIPSMGLLLKASRFIMAFSKEAYGTVTDDEELTDKAYPLKYFFNMIPGLAQFQTDYLPYLDPELAHELGIRVTVEARR